MSVELISSFDGVLTLDTLWFNKDHLIRFAEQVKEIRGGWEKTIPDDGTEIPGGLLLFSGDLFSPSVESMLTRGSNMARN